MAASADISNSALSRPATELRIVLIGGRSGHISSGKSSAGNIILGHNVFDTSRRTAQSEARQQEVLGRRLTVVDTPGWWWFYPREETPKLDQIEIHKSVHLCPPGPHVFLLVIPVSLYLSHHVKLSLQEHLKLFIADVLSHTIVLFTAVHPCSDETIESKIRRSPALQWILQQCGNRKHVLNISNREDRDQVKILLEKIEAMIEQNRGRHCSVDESDGNALRERLKDLVKKASKRFDEVQKQRRNQKLQIEGGKVPPNHLRILMIGESYVGKSSAGNIILGKNAFSLTESVGRTTTGSEISHSVVEGRRLTVVDSPGWFFIHTLQDTSEMDKLEIENSVNLCPPGQRFTLFSISRPHVFLLVVPIFRAFTEKDLKALVEVLMPLTARVWRHCMVLFTRGDWLNGLPVENYIIREGKELQELLEKCGNRYHVLNNFDYNDPVQVKELFRKIINMVKQNKGCFMTEGKRKKFQFLPQLGKKRMLMEEEWNRREQELMERVMKALAKEPEKPTVPSVEVANSKDDFMIPDMSGDDASEYGNISEIRNQRAHNNVAEWLTKTVRQSEISSGIGSTCSS
ncbi:PREDICTED: GTPase IMAP family member 8-like [Cyprinodon variegatus]|uniref:GTPase IMAP family member 8-like n=1 Tax=Cyprinodon variegatus TaxID=28743 RepID=UPI000742598D|nr:PREDICTED: GTPase IMAP family member 8-like [Cyprinodon variegatus]